MPLVQNQLRCLADARMLPSPISAEPDATMPAARPPIMSSDAAAIRPQCTPCASAIPPGTPASPVSTGRCSDDRSVSSPSAGAVHGACHVVFKLPPLTPGVYRVGTAFRDVACFRPSVFCRREIGRCDDGDQTPHVGIKTSHPARTDGHGDGITQNTRAASGSPPATRAASGASVMEQDQASALEAVACFCFAITWL